MCILSHNIIVIKDFRSVQATPVPKRDSQRLMFFVVSMFLDEMPAIAAIGTAYKCTDAGCATRVVYIGKAEARSCHQCLVSSLSRPSLLHLPLSVY